MKEKNFAALSAFLAAALYAINIPFSKLLLEKIGAVMMASLLYLGAGLGMLVYSRIEHLVGRGGKIDKLSRKELPYTVMMVLLDVAAPILLMMGLSITNASNASLLNNFEIVATSLVAFIIFKEKISLRLLVAIVLVTISSVILSFEGGDAFRFNKGSLLVLLATLCWGFENNATRMISTKDSKEIVIIKGIFSGFFSLILALLIGERLPGPEYILYSLVLGFISYGMSINLYILAQKSLGAAKTSCYYALNPFLGSILGMLLLREKADLQFIVAITLMLVATLFMVRDTVLLVHTHEHVHVHSHEHRHGSLVHTHEHQHVHTHYHSHMRNGDEHEHGPEELGDGHVHKHA